MPKFNYVAKDKEANVIRGTMEVYDESFVIKELKKRNLIPIEIAPEKEKVVPVAAGGGGRVKSMDLVVFSRQLATLIDSGISLVMGLSILYDQIESKNLKKIILEIKNDIEAGNSLSAAFSKYPKVFPAIFSNMIRAGETSGSLNEILERVADYLERLENLKRKLKSSLTYPTVVIGMAVIIDGFLLLKVVPTFKKIFENLGGQLPLPTLILVTISNLSIRLFPFLILFLIISIVVFIRYIRSPGGRVRFDSFKLKSPVFGPLIKKVAISKFARTLATLVRSGVSILEAFEIAGKVVDNKIIEKACDQTRLRLRSGESIAVPMSESGQFPPFVVKMIAVGEETGELEKMLSKISDYYDDQVNDSLASLTSMIEPLVIAFLGISVGFIVLSMFLPIFKLATLVGR